MRIDFSCTWKEKRKNDSAEVKRASGSKVIVGGGCEVGGSSSDNPNVEFVNEIEGVFDFAGGGDCRSM